MDRPPPRPKDQNQDTATRDHHRAGDARIVGAKDEALIMQQLFTENTLADPQVIVFDDLWFEAGEPH